MRRKFLTQRAMRHCHRLARETVGAPYLEELKARLDEVLGSLLLWVAALLKVGGWDWVGSKLPSNLHHSVILQIFVRLFCLFSFHGYSQLLVETMKGLCSYSTYLEHALRCAILPTTRVQEGCRFSGCITLVLC